MEQVEEEIKAVIAITNVKVQGCDNTGYRKDLGTLIPKQDSSLDSEGGREGRFEGRTCSGEDALVADSERYTQCKATALTRVIDTGIAILMYFLGI